MTGGKKAFIREVFKAYAAQFLEDEEEDDVAEVPRQGAGATVDMLPGQVLSLLHVARAQPCSVSRFRLLSGGAVVGLSAKDG